jgi:hypothetical protein
MKSAILDFIESVLYERLLLFYLFMLFCSKEDDQSKIDRS